MCLVCVEIQKGIIKPTEFAEKIAATLKESPEHEEELLNALTKADQEYLDKLEEYLYKQLFNDVSDFTKLLR